MSYYAYITSIHRTAMAIFRKRWLLCWVAIAVVFCFFFCRLLWRNYPFCKTTELRHGKGDGIVSMAVIPGTNFIVVSTLSTGRVELWDIQTKTCNRVYKTSNLTGIASHPNGDWFASNGTGDWIERRSISDPLKLFYYPESSELRRAILFSPSGKLLASGGWHGVKVWNASSGEIIAGFDHINSVNAISFYEDRLIAACTNGVATIRIWDLSNKRLLTSLNARIDVVTALFFIDESTLLSMGYTRGQQRSFYGELRVWDISAGICKAHLTTADDNCICSGFLSPDKSWFAAGCMDGILLIGDTQPLRITKRVPAHQGPIESLAFFSDRGLLATSSNEASMPEPIRLWDVNCLQNK